MILTINNKKVRSQEGELLLFSLLENNLFAQGEVKDRARGCFCGMGVCQECLVTVNNQEKLACQTVIEKGMEVITNEQ